MPHVGLVTDSTCDLGPELLRTLDVRMVPLKVLFGDESFRDWVDLLPTAFYEKLTTSFILPKTSQPSPADFLEIYRSLADEGCDSIVSIHLTSALSGTISSALMAAEDSPIPVDVVDTKKVSHALGLVVKAAVESREQGLDAAAIAARARDVAESVRLLFVLDTLDYLVKGGRAGKAQGLAATMLNIKPVLQMNEEGVIEPFRKVKGRKRALAETAAAVAEYAEAAGPLRVGVLHACLPDSGAELADAILATGADVVFDEPVSIGAVIGTYAGPGAIGVAFYPL